MDLMSAPVLDVRPLMPEERCDLLTLLSDLTDEEWSRPSVATEWTVKELALHLLDDDLGWLSRGRDRDQSGSLRTDEPGGFVAALTAKNQQWVEGAAGLSRTVVIGLLEWSGQQMDAYYGSMDLRGFGRVAWASDGAVPVWFDIAQDLTERWVHQMQIREAVGRVDEYRDRFLPLVLRTFVWALPHQYREDAEPASTIVIDLTQGGVWTLTCQGDGRWVLSAGGVESPDAEACFDADTGWRWLTGGRLRQEDLAWAGPERFREPLLRIRGILV
ncbi:maleylpyruvate isomerase N-terminal domain-containing protein [Knoellia sp. Soil729]|uniref:maleylpyruvate isomerase N-terminal domain-containing protein n=1 Tax=Knoellia sp. Soil729 TaxID=1736394 RepID=UPI0012E7B5C6|nr:maleylpyruvate isomerase N-terminal domain-containing protein [Knoellia sp. Soil729]